MACRTKVLQEQRQYKQEEPMEQHETPWLSEVEFCPEKEALSQQSSLEAIGQDQQTTSTWQVKNKSKTVDKVVLATTH